MHILILDADPLVLTALADTVRRRLPGLGVHAATSFHAGLKKLTTRGYDALIVEAQLTDASGVAAFSMLHQRYPDTPVILMAAQFDQSLMAHATLSGVYHYLHKPIEQNVFMALLNRVMECRRFGGEIDQLTAKANRHTKRARKAIAYSRLLIEAKERLLSRRQYSLEQSESQRDRLAKVADDLRLGILLLDQSWRIVWLNSMVPPALCAKSREEMLGRLMWEACPDLIGSVFERECRRAAQDQTAIRFVSRFSANDPEYDVDANVCAEGMSILFQQREAAEREHGGQGNRGQDPHSFINVSGDQAAVSAQSSITFARGPQQGSSPDSNWKHLSEQVQCAREAERARIARDLHDDLGQLLAALKTDLAWLDARLSPQQLPSLLKVRFMAHLVNRMADAVRRICSELRPAILDDLGLAAAMQWQASTFEHRTGLRCIVSIKGIDRLESDQSTGLFRVFQELLTNAPLHARATVVWITLKEKGSGLVLEVNDNGPDTPQSDLDAKIQNLANLHERVLLLGGELSLKRQPGQSASIIVTIPLAKRPTDGKRMES